MEKKYIKLLILLLFTVISAENLYATHIRAGEITAVRDNCQSRTFTFTLTAYTDSKSQVEHTFGSGMVNFGDGSPEVVLNDIKDYSTNSPMGNDVTMRKFVFTHTFPSNGDFLVSYKEDYRNSNVLNMHNSVLTSFYIETKIILDPFFGCNDTPVLLIPPVDKGFVGIQFLHNPGAFDANGDSLSYKLVVNQQDKDKPVNQYVYPNHPRFEGKTEDGSGLATFTLDSLNGDLLWNTPGTKGEYNIAFIVEEWRKIEGEYFNMGYVTRDMQIIVDDDDNERPELEVPADTCVEAGAKISGIIKATDPDGDDIKIETHGGAYTLSSSPATYSPNPFTMLPSPAVMDVEWQTNCSHVRKLPYAFHFKALDRSTAEKSSVDFKIWNVTVVAPAPQGLTSAAQPGRAINLQWNNYECGNAEKMQIWRRVGSYNFEPKGCELGMPADAGYELISEVPINLSAYRDDNNGEGLDVGANYCYRLVAIFAQPSGGKSYASQETCTILDATAPVITNVSIEKTSESNGEVVVKWTPPYDIDENLFPPPYTYEVVRWSDDDTPNQEVLDKISDTTYVDKGLNTTHKIYNYSVRLYDGSGSQNAVISSATASTVRLDLKPMLGGMVLSWNAKVPWTNRSAHYPMHYIYRNQVNSNSPDTFTLIDSVDVIKTNGFKYLDDGSFNEEPLSDEVKYDYFVLTQGTYENPKIINPLKNKSQIVGDFPNDTIPPCTPSSFVMDEMADCREFVKYLDCDYKQYQNHLSWQKNLGEGCDDDVVGYNIYFSPTEEEESFKKIDFVKDTEFTHAGLSSMAGCYRISSVDRSGNISELSEKICIDNCPYFELPNLFTPGLVDQKNDVFSAYPNIPEHCPRFVKSLKFKVLSRYGQEVYSFKSNGENTIYINWDGRSNNGTLLSDGTYYYIADVEFITLDPKDSKKTYNGWIRLMR